MAKTSNNRAVPAKPLFSPRPKSGFSNNARSGSTLAQLGKSLNVPGTVAAPLRRCAGETPSGADSHTLIAFIESGISCFATRRPC
jgi:hypothetical protein